MFPPCHTREDAERAKKSLEELVDWSLPIDELRRRVTLRRISETIMESWKW